MKEHTRIKFNNEDVEKFVEKHAQCIGKKRINSKKKAEEVASRMNKKYWPSKFDSYRCKHCGKYHIGHAQRSKLI